MKKVLYAAALFFLATACTTKSENKPYTWEEDLHQRLLTDFSRTETEVSSTYSPAAWLQSMGSLLEELRLFRQSPNITAS